MKYFVLVTFLLLGLPKQVLGNPPYPQPKFSSGGTLGWVDDSWIANTPGRVGPAFSFEYPRLLGQHATVFPKLRNGKPRIVRFYDGFQVYQQGFYVYNSEYLQTRYVLYPAYYIIKENMSIGYCLLTFSGSSDITPYRDTSLIVMRNIPVNPDYLSGVLQLPPDTEIVFHESRHGGYIERYGLAYFSVDEETERVFLLVEAFYPEELDGHFTETVAKHLNTELADTYAELQASPGK
jgi:hypothetical protein